MVENLDGKINSELTDLNKNIEKMQIELSKFTDLKNLQEVSEITKVYLNQMKERYIQRRDFMKSKVKTASSTYEINKANLEKSDTWKSLLDLEDKIRRQGQVIFTLQENVKAKEHQTDYESMKKECLNMVNTLVLIRLQSLVATHGEVRRIA